MLSHQPGKRLWCSRRPGSAPPWPGQARLLRGRRCLAPYFKCCPVTWRGHPYRPALSVFWACGSKHFCSEAGSPHLCHTSVSPNGAEQRGATALPQATTCLRTGAAGQTPLPPPPRGRLAPKLSLAWLVHWQSWGFRARGRLPCVGLCTSPSNTKMLSAPVRALEPKHSE